MNSFDGAKNNPFSRPSKTMQTGTVLLHPFPYQRGEGDHPDFHPSPPHNFRFFSPFSGPFLLMAENSVVFEGGTHFLQPRSHSLCSNLLFSTSSGANGISGQSLSTIPGTFQQEHNQQTLVGAETFDGQFLGGQSARLANSGGNGSGGVNFGRRVSRQDPQRWHLSNSWLERVFQRRECIKFIPGDAHSDRCHCGRVSALHSQLALSRFTSSLVTRGDLASVGQVSGQWTICTCTAGSPTDAYGTIEFQGGTHVHKARYVRLSFDSDPGDVMTLMERIWGLERPRLVISVHGGTANFGVPEKLGRVFREGLLKAAETTGAWVLTSGLDSGVVKHVARALDEAGISARMRSRIVTVGIAPWGLLQGQEQLVGRHSHISYDRQSPRTGRGGLLLNDRHSYFLLADNGTVDRYGADIVLRRRLEQFLARKANGSGASMGRGGRIPIICVALEGGVCSLNAIHQYLHGIPPIPVIICEGSGRVSDLLATAERHLDERGKLPADVRSLLLASIGQLTCHSGPHSLVPNSAEAILERIVECASHRNKLLTVFRVREHLRSEADKMDRIILHALLHGQSLSPVDQLLLTLAWGREDIARSEIFRPGEFPPDPDWLDQPMMEALLMANVEYVRLLLEQGLSAKRFLTFERLEQLYNSGQALGPLMASKRRANWGAQGSPKRAFSLPEIGAAIERLMGNGFRSAYTTRAFKARYERAKSRGKEGGGQPMSRSATRQFSSLHMCLGGGAEQDELLAQQPQRKCALASPPFSPREGEQHQLPPHFGFPFNELMLWAVLTRRHEMAKLFWQYGEEPMAKALAAIRLYKGMSREAAHDYTELEASNQLRECAQAFRECSLELLSHCHQQDQRMTMRLLTAELPNWGAHTCLSLAVIANNKRFLAHPCCQILLAELWHGGLRFRSRSNVKVVLGLLCPPSILLLDFKTPNAVERPGMEGEGPEGEQEQDQLLMNHLGEANGRLGHSGGKRRPASEQKALASAMSKFGMFYSAPITSFWVWSMSFLAFMLALIFVLLVEFPREVPPLEWLLFAFVLALAMEHFRKLLLLEASSFFEKLRIFYNQYWNILTTVAVLSYFLGFSFRFDPQKMHSHSRVILAANSVLWHMKMFDFLSVHPRIGPYITMAGKMVLAMSYIIVLLMVTLMAFGVARQSITFPHEKWAWILVRNIFYKPYFMLYGEVYAGEIDTCGDEGTNCVPGHWIPPILMTVFLLIANILLINMLIAIFNNIFNVTNAMAQQVWMFQRYGQVLEYKSTPVLPPPFTPLAHLLMLVRHFCKASSVCPFHQEVEAKSPVIDGDFALKVQLGPEELRELQDFEEDCMDDLSRRKYRQTTAQNEWHNHGMRELEGGEWTNGESRKVLVKLQKLQLRVDQLGQAQQRLLDLLGSPPSEIGKKSVLASRSKKFIPRARIQPISSSAPATSGFGQFHEEFQPQLRSSPHIPVPPGEGETHGNAPAHFTLFEEETAEEEEAERPEGTWNWQMSHSPPQMDTAARQRNYSVSLGEDLEQMFGMLRRWTEGDAS